MGVMLIMLPVQCSALLVALLAPTQNDTTVWAEFLAEARSELGEEGAEAAAFLAAHRPERDAGIKDSELLLDNLRLALEARASSPWGSSISDELFFNDVLPYAVLDETRENWRPRLRQLTLPIVKDARTLEEAALAINAKLFKEINVHYNKGRKKPNASPSESIREGRATCTGLTILAVDACRSVGIPARAAGVARWHDDRGNHTWAEIWDGERWRFFGADEYDPKGLDRGWFVRDASQATPASESDVNHAVWASSWKATGNYFPLVWNRRYRGVHGVEVTERYASPQESDVATLGLEGEALGEEASERLIQELWQAKQAELTEQLSTELEAQAFRHGDFELRIKERKFGEEPPGGHSLWISMHGGGGTAPEVNDRQWENQIRLYEPAEGYYVAPRAPTNSWDLWHKPHVDDLFDRMIQAYVACRGVNPDRVYLMGYSAGGDGVYRLAPRMADRYAAAAMMAGHPAGIKPDSLRNLPFALYMGAEDGAYNRNRNAARWRVALAQLRANDPEGYDHRVMIYPGKGHWMDGEDKEALPWMARRTRNVWPKRVVWIQDHVSHSRFYWLEVDPAEAKKGQRITAAAHGQTIELTTETDTKHPVKAVTLHLTDRLVDLDHPITVTWNGTQIFQGPVPRTRQGIERSLATSLSQPCCGTAMLTVSR